MTLDAYIDQLNAIAGDITPIVDGFIKKHQGALLTSVKLRFWNKGIDGDGKLIGEYAASTKELKKKSAFNRTSHVTLRDSGAWYNSLFISYNKGELLLDSHNKELTRKLIDGEPQHFFTGYGEAIMQFTDDEKDLLIEVVLDELQKYLETRFNGVIEL